MRKVELNGTDQNGSVVPDISWPPVFSLRILVVNDVHSNRKLLRRLPENREHHCEETENGRKAVEMDQSAIEMSYPYDSVRMDYEMPVMDGPAAAKEMRSMGYDIIIGVTRNVLPEDVKHFKSCGANEVISKPVKIAELDALWYELGRVYDSVAADRYQSKDY